MANNKNSLVTVNKPHYRRTEQVYALLNQAPPFATYDRLIEYVRGKTGKGCSRKLISKWKKTFSVSSEQLPVISKLTKNSQDKSDDNNTDVLSLVNSSEQNSLDSSFTELISEINQTEFEILQDVKLAESQANSTIICDKYKQEDKPKIVHQTLLPNENELTDDCSLNTESDINNNLQAESAIKRSLTNNANNDSLLNNDNDLPPICDHEKTGHWSLITDHCKAWSYVAATTIMLGIAGCGWFFSKDNSQPVIAQPTSIQNEQPSIQNPKSKIQNGLPRSIKIDLTLSHPQDLKVKPGDEVTQGTVLSDRTLERQRLVSQKKQLQLSLKKLDLPIPPITNPEPISKIGKLPPVSYQQEEANIALKQQELAEAEKAIANQQEKIRQLSELLPVTQSVKAVQANPDLEQNLSEIATNSIVLPKPEADLARENESSITATQSKGEETPVALIIEHEQAILSQLQAARDKAQLQLDIAKSKLITAKEKRAHDEYQRYIEENRRAIAIQQQQIELERQRSIRAGQIQEREYSKSQIEAKIQEIDNAISSLSTVKAPYPGKIKKVKWTGQDNHHLTVQLTLDVDDGSEQQANSKFRIQNSK